MPHVLVRMAKRSPRRQHPSLPNGATYDAIRGFWRLGEQVLVRAPQYISGPVTKKADQETGEDQKGE